MFFLVTVGAVLSVGALICLLACCGCNWVVVCAGLQCVGWSSVWWGKLAGCMFFLLLFVAFLVRCCGWVSVC